MTKKKPLSSDLLAECKAAHALFLTKKNELNLSQRKIADAAEISAPAVNLYFKGTNALNLSFALVLSRMLKEPIERFSERLARQHLQIASEGRSPLRYPAPTLADYDGSVSAGPPLIHRVPLLTWVQAGEMCQTGSYMFDDAEVMLDCPFPHSERAFCLRVSGDSMSPEYREGEVILIDPAMDANHGDDIVVITPEGKTTFKRLQRTPDGTHLLALNADFPNRIIHVPDDTHICGVVTASWMNRRRS